MKNIIFTFILILAGNIVLADCGCANLQPECKQITNNCEEVKRQTKCLDLMTTMYNNRATLYNVLNLSTDQKKCKDVIDAKRYEELGEQFKKFEQEKYVLTRMNEHQASKQALKKQEKVVNDIEKCMQKTNKKYDKEFKTVLNSEQKTKLNMIRRMEKKAIKHCEKNKAFYKQDPNLRPFGEKMYGTDNKLCPEHNKWHLFGFKHKTK